MPVLTKINSIVIADDAISVDKLGGSAYLANTATQNITGTYSESRLYTSDAYTLSGNATFNSDVVLSSVKPTDDVVLTAGGAYTLTGTGTLSGGSLLAKTRSDLTGMTGEIGGVVTGSPNLNLGNSSFPTGNVVQVVTSIYTGAAIAIGQTATVVSQLTLSLTPKSASNKIIIQNWHSGIYTTTNGAGLRIGIQSSVNGWSSSLTLGSSLYMGGYANYGSNARKEHFIITTPLLDMPSLGTTQSTIEFRMYCQMNSGTMNINQDGAGVDTTGFIGWEIQA